MDLMSMMKPYVCQQFQINFLYAYQAPQQVVRSTMTRHACHLQNSCTCQLQEAHCAQLLRCSGRCYFVA